LNVDVVSLSSAPFRNSDIKATYLKLGYSPEQIAGTLKLIHPQDPTVSHEIQGPNLIELLIVFKWLSLPRDNPFLGLTF